VPPGRPRPGERGDRRSAAAAEVVRDEEVADRAVDVHGRAVGRRGGPTRGRVLVELEVDVRVAVALGADPGEVQVAVPADALLRDIRAIEVVLRGDRAVCDLDSG